MSDDSNSQKQVVTPKQREKIKVRQVQMFKDPTLQQNKMIYQNVETMSHLTNVAMNTCHLMGIDYRDLLRHSGEKQVSVHESLVSSDQKDVHERLMELKRKRRVIQVATKITRDRLGGIKNRNRSAKANISKLE